MKHRKIKEWTVGFLAVAAFFFIVCFNPSDDSPTFTTDFFKAKLIGVCFALLAVFVAKYRKIENLYS